MHDIMVACQELDAKDVRLYKSAPSAFVTPTTVALAVADRAIVPTVVDLAVEPEPLDEEACNAISWATKLHDHCNVVALVRALPAAVVEEQVALFKRRDDTPAVAATSRPTITVGVTPGYRVQQLVCEQLFAFCRSRGAVMGARMPRGYLKLFMSEHIKWVGKQPSVAVRGKRISKWYSRWRKEDGTVAAVADDAPSERAAHLGPKHMLKSIAPRQLCHRKRASGGGRHHKAQHVRAALFEWFTSIRYAIDWKQLIANNRSRGRIHLARFPASMLKLKAQQFIQDYVHVCLVNGQPVVSFTPDSHWFRRWEADYGLSMRRANRKYAVPRRIVKERLEILWVVLFRIRYFIFLVFGYDPLIDNWDQSPFNNNETGSQNKPILAVRGTIVPVVEGNSDVKCRWTANLTTTSQFTTGTMPPAECMFKAEKDGRTDKRLQEFIRSRGFPKWFSVTVAPKGSYREYDVIRFLEKHLEPWTDGRDWRIILCDDYSAHKSENVWNLCWSRGYIRLCHGGGVTPVAQTPDTDLNEHVRRRYGNVEASMLLDKMRYGQVVPKLTQEECMEVMFRVLSDPELHKSASAGFKKVGQSIDLHGAEDALICREAGVFWNEETTDTYSSMRPKIGAELATVASEFASGGIAWSEGDVKRLIMEYPPRPAVDRILDNLGQDFYHDAIHDIPDGDVVGDDDKLGLVLFDEGGNVVKTELEVAWLGGLA
jgi:hypothetical protein